MNIVFLVVALVLFIAFIAAAWMGARTWKIGHILLLAGLFLATFGLVYLTAGTLRTHQKYRERYNRLEQELAREVQQRDQLKNPQLAGPGQSLPELRAELGRLLLDRGRVWRGVTFSNFENSTLTINMSGWGDEACAKLGGTADEDSFDLEPVPMDEGDEPAGEVPAQKQHGIVEGMTLFLFEQSPIASIPEEVQTVLFGASDLAKRDQNGVCQLPTYYLGDFKVASVAPDSISLEPISRLAPDQLAAIENSNGASWALFEIMPIDRHDVFAGLDEAQLRMLMPQEGSGLTDAQYAGLMQSYLQDDQPADRSADPARTLKEVEFIKERTFDVDADTDEPQIDESFDHTGRAVLAQLRLGEPVVFQPGDTAYFDTNTADKLVADGFAKETDQPTKFVRRLRDYLYLFRSVGFEQEQVADTMSRLQSESATVIEAARKANEQIAYRTDERNKLREDKGNFDRELSVLQEYLGRIEQARTAQRQQLSALYRSNRNLTKQLESGRSGRLTSLAKPPQSQ
ncbi:MAG: hypothetical protein KDA60_11075 [Planctomycetales bacterium]|nr:hypothetical protein [Planctomycetales bacterium]